MYIQYIIDYSRVHSVSSRRTIRDCPVLRVLTHKVFVWAHWMKHTHFVCTCIWTVLYCSDANHLWFFRVGSLTTNRRWFFEDYRNLHFLKVILLTHSKNYFKKFPGGRRPRTPFHVISYILLTDFICQFCRFFNEFSGGVLHRTK